MYHIAVFLISQLVPLSSDWTKQITAQLNIADHSSIELDISASGAFFYSSSTVRRHFWMSPWLIRLILLMKTFLWNVTPVEWGHFSHATGLQLNGGCMFVYVCITYEGFVQFCTNFICAWSVQYVFSHDHWVTTTHVPVCECMKSNYMHHVATNTLVASKALGVVSYYSAAGVCPAVCSHLCHPAVVITSHKMMFLMMLLRHYAPWKRLHWDKRMSVSTRPYCVSQYN